MEKVSKLAKSSGSVARVCERNSVSSRTYSGKSWPGRVDLTALICHHRLRDEVEPDRVDDLVDVLGLDRLGQGRRLALAGRPALQQAQQHREGHLQEDVGRAPAHHFVLGEGHGDHRRDDVEPLARLPAQRAVQVVHVAVVEGQALVLRVIPDQHRVDAEVAVEVEAVALVGLLAHAEELEHEGPVIGPGQLADRGHVVKPGAVERELVRGQRLLFLRFVLRFHERDAERDAVHRDLFLARPGFGVGVLQLVFGDAQLGRGQARESAPSRLTRPCLTASAARSASSVGVTSHSPRRARSVISSTAGAAFRWLAQSLTRSGSVRASVLAAPMVVVRVKSRFWTV